MNTTAIILILLTLPSSLALSATTSVSLKDLASQEILEYGKALYTRGDYAAASQAICRAVRLDPDNAAAQQYLHKARQQHPAAIESCDVPALVTPIAVEKPYHAPSLASNDDLKRAIEAEDRAINSLKQEIQEISNETETVGHEEN